MKKAISLFLAVVLCFVLCACGGGNVKDNVPETTLSAKGNLELAQELIKNNKYEDAYVLLYGIEKRSAEEEALFARFSFVLAKSESVGKGPTTVKIYNEQGLVMEQSEAYSSGDIYRTITERDEQGNIVSESKFEPSSSIPKVTYCEYDENGRETSQVNDTGSIQSIYDSNGNKIASIVTFAQTGQTLTTNYTYDASGNMISESTSAGWYTSYSYDDSGNLIKEVHYKNNEEKNSTNYTYNDLNLLTEKTYTETNGDKKVTNYTYDDYGNLITEITGDTIRSWECTYDKYGNLVKGVLSLNGEEYSTTTYTYQLLYQTN